MATTTEMLAALRLAFRAYATDGVPGSGEHEPDKAEIYAAHALVKDAIDLVAASIAIGYIPFATKAALDADLAYDANTGAIVWGDGTAANNAVYKKSGASGSGSWTKISELEDVLASFAAAAAAAVVDAEAAATAAEGFADDAADIVASIPVAFGDTAATDKGISTGFLDADSRVLVAFSPAGRLQDSEVFARDVVEQAGAIAPYFVLPAPHGFTITQKDYNIAYMMGQSLGAGYWSLADGTGATAVLTTSQPYNNKMLAKIWTPTAGAGSFSAAIEQIQSTHYGETGMAASVNQTKFMRDGFVPPWASWTQDWVVGSNAVVSTAISGIIQGTTPYNNAKAAVTQMRALAGSSCALRDVQLEHGESDMLAGMSQATYYAAIVDLLDDIQIDFAAITGQTDTIFMLMAQPTTQSIYSTSSDLVPSTALAMLQAHEGNTDMFLVGPKYQYQYSRNDKGTGRDGVHLSNHGYRHHGCKVGQVRHHLYNLKRRWEPLRPSKLTQISRDTLEIEFIVLCPPLVFDTKTVSNPGDMGFVVYDSGGTEQSVDRVWISGPNKVRIKTVSALPSNWEVSYAYKVYNRTSGSHRFSGSRGNLRDSDNTPSLYNDAQGKPYSMWNWCVMFRKTET